MCTSTVDIHSAATEIRRGKKKKKPQVENIMSASATHGGLKKQTIQEQNSKKYKKNKHKSKENLNQRYDIDL